MKVLFLIVGFVWVVCCSNTGKFSGTWGVHMKDGTDPQVITSLGFTLVNRIGTLRSSFEIAHPFVTPESTPDVIENAERSLRNHPSIIHFEQQYNKKMAHRQISFPDPLYPNQWHLNNTGQSLGTPGEDIHIAGAWEMGYSGRGVRIAIVDDGYQYTHPDLAVGYAAESSYNINGGNTDPAPDLRFDFHGTAAAGVALASNNSVCGVGAAYGAQGSGIRLISDYFSDADTAMGLTFKYQDNHIYSNSWGPYDNGVIVEGPGYFTRLAMEDAIQNGRGGLGTIYVWAAGNGLANEDNCNYDGFVNSRLTIGVGAIDNNGKQSYYSEPCSAMLVTAPSSGNGVGITTTDLLGSRGYSATDCTATFGGTSSACPLVAGVIALMLQANPNLTWLDVQHILVQTADQNDPTDPDWTVNGAGLLINHKYGFGRVNATAAVQSAISFPSLPQTSKYSFTNLIVNQSIPDGQTNGTSHTVLIEILGVTLDHVEVTVNIPDFVSGGDLIIILTSPSGTQSVLAEEHAYGVELTASLPVIDPLNEIYVLPALFGPTIHSPINGTLAAPLPPDACDVITNCAELQGQLALVNRSQNCNFTDQVYRMQECGSIAVVVVNNVAGGPQTMPGSNPNITIPSVMISLDDGEDIIAYMQNAIVVFLINATQWRYDVDFTNWTFSTVRNWGEAAHGNWTIEVIDVYPGGLQGHFASWDLHLYGYQPVEDAENFPWKWVIIGVVGSVFVVAILAVGLFVHSRRRVHYNALR